MNTHSRQDQIIISPQIFVTLEPQETSIIQEIQPRRTEIPMVWIQDGNSFRLDIELPNFSTLDVLFSAPVDSLHVNGETIWSNNTVYAGSIAGACVETSPLGLRLTCSSGGKLHILALGVIAKKSEAHEG
jgi:hypothetical protein